jgi:thioredoxin reductase
MMPHERYGVPFWVVTNGEKLAVSADTRRVLEVYRIPVLESPIVDIKGGMGGRVLNQLVLEDGTSVPARYAMVAMGLYRVYNDLAAKLGMELEAEGPPETRHVLIDMRGESSVKGAFAVGDMARRRDGEPVMKQVYTAQEYAVRAVDAIDGRLRRERRAAALAAQAGPP